MKLTLLYNGMLSKTHYRKNFQLEKGVQFFFIQNTANKGKTKNKVVQIIMTSRKANYIIIAGLPSK